MTPAKTAPRCLHSERGECPKCREFSRSLIAAVEDRAAQWRPGILARLNAQSNARN